MIMVKIKESWLKACGKEDLAGQFFPARFDERASYSPMGNCFEVEMPDGSYWTTFACRCEEIKEV